MYNVEDSDPDPHGSRYFEKPDPDPDTYQSEKPHLDTHQSQKGL